MTGPYASTQPVIDPKERRSPDRRGLFVVIDGLDGIGKGVVERALIEYEQRLGKATFDSISWSRAHASGLPELTDFWNPPNTHYHTVITAEPTYAGTGRDVRQELVARNGRDYPPRSVIAGYSLDREMQMRKVVIPALKNNLSVIQGRCVASTICYQGQARKVRLEDIPKFVEELKEYEGNRMQLAEWAPDLLIIPTIDNVQKVVDRIKSRSRSGKDDKVIFDNLEFQEKIKPFYESDQLRNVFERAGTKVEYLDAGKTVEDTIEQTTGIYKRFLESIRS